MTSSSPVTDAQRQLSPPTCPRWPVIVRNDLAGDLDQLAVVLAENESRDALTMGEQVAAVQQMLDLGSNAAVIGRKTGLPLRRLRNISRIAKSTDDVREAIHTHQPTLDQAVTLTKYADDAELLTQLIASLESPGQFALLVRRAEEESVAKQPWPRQSPSTQSKASPPTPSRPCPKKRRGFTSWTSLRLITRIARTGQSCCASSTTAGSQTAKSVSTPLTTRAAPPTAIPPAGEG